MEEAVRVSRDGGVLTIVLDRPKANAIDLPTYRKLLTSDDAEEGVSAFVDKRDANFKGK